MFAFLIPYCMGGIAGPAIAIHHFRQCSVRDEQGELQGALTGLISITSIAGPPMMTGLFSYSTKLAAPVHFSGAAFFMGFLLMLSSAFIAYKTLHIKKIKKAQ